MSKVSDSCELLSGFVQQCRHRHDLCRVAPAPEVRERIQATLNRLGLGSQPSPEAAVQPAAAEEAPRRGRKAAAKKAAAPKKAAADAAVEDFVTSMLRLRQRNPPGLNDGLIIPGDEFPVGTPLRVVRSAALERAPLSGSVRVIVVLVNFSDRSMTENRQHFQDLFFSTGVIPTGSVKEYFKEVSNGIINLEGDVVGPFNLGNTMAHYANGDSGTGPVEPNARTMAREAAVAANPTVNFAPFDNDGNGFVDAFIVIHAGSGAEQTLNVNDIWSHKWVLAGGPLNADGTKIFGYLTIPEDARIGVCAHELGHLLFGWPDLYDTDGSSEGIGNWCLMAGGSWNNDGLTPAHPSAWCKANQGWVSVVVQTANQVVSIPDVKTSRKVHRLWKDGTGGSEYFLVENRQRAKFDQHLPGDGLLIWHIDETISGNENEAHPKVALEQADGLKQLEGAINRGDDADPYPGSGNKRTFSRSSVPNSRSYAGVDTCVSVTEIGPSGATMTARLSVKCAAVKQLAKELVDNKSIGTDKAVTAEKHLIDKQAEKPILDKNVEKPVIDKSAGLDKNPAEGKLLEGGGGPFPARGAEPFIGQDLRPDLTKSALAGEEDYQQADQPQIASPQLKRTFDTKVREA